MVNQNGNNDAVAKNNSHEGMPQAAWLVPESLLAVMWRSRWIITLATVMALAAAFVYLSKATPIYTSTSRIHVQQSGPRIFTGTEEGVMTQSKNYLYTQAELLTSSSVLMAVLDDPSIRQMRTLARLDNPIAHLGKNLRVNVGKKDDIINISFDSPYPAEAAHVVNATVNAYLDYNSSSKRSTSTEVLNILQFENAERLEELSMKHQAMLEFKKLNKALAFEGSNGNIVIGRLERLSQVLTEAQLAAIESESRYEFIKEMFGDPGKLRQFVEAQQARGVYFPTASQKAQLNSQLDQLELRLANRLRQVNSGHPAAMALDIEIANLKAQLVNLDNEFAQAQLAVAEQEYLAAKEKEVKIAKHYTDQSRQALDLSQQVDQYAMLQSDWEQTKKLCDTLNDRIRELNVTEDVGALNVSILEIARPPRDPSKPEKARCMAMALVMGLMLGGGLALLREFKDQRFHSRDEISATLALTVLGVVPSMPTRETIVSRGQKVYLDPLSSSAEAYRTIRTAIFFSVPKDKAKTILITSAAPGDGKSTLASNLAIASAQAGQKTLLLDADFRKPTQHKIFEVKSRNCGFADAFAGIITLERAILSTSVEGLELLSCGAELSNASEVLGSNEFARFLKRLSKIYDRIIIDSPPVMPVTDAQILAAMCDTTLLVLRVGNSNSKTCRRACEVLRDVNARLIGAVINDVSRKSDYYGQFSDYGNYSSYYGSSRRKSKGVDKPLLALSTGGGQKETMNEPHAGFYPMKSPRCGAKTRKGTPCRSPVMANGICRMHGGKSTGHLVCIENPSRVVDGRAILPVSPYQQQEAGR
jgi:capsular exopolysaccharide synthesis family protein